MNKLVRVTERAVLVLTLVCLTITSRADVLGFESPPLAPGAQDSYGPGREYLEGGFRLATSTAGGYFGSIIRFNPSGVSVLPNDGTVHFGATIYSRPVLDRPDGALFSIEQIDLAHYSQYFVTNHVNLRGNKPDGTFVSASFTLPSWFDPAFHAFQFDQSWSGLQSVSFLTDGFACDNIVVSVVPEPCCASLLVVGLLSVQLRRSGRERGNKAPNPTASVDAPIALS